MGIFKSLLKTEKLEVLLGIYNDRNSETTETAVSLKPLGPVDQPLLTYVDSPRGQWHSVRSGWACTGRTWLLPHSPYTGIGRPQTPRQNRSGSHKCHLIRFHQGHIHKLGTQTCIISVNCKLWETWKVSIAFYSCYNCFTLLKSLSTFKLLQKWARAAQKYLPDFWSLLSVDKFHPLFKKTLLSDSKVRGPEKIAILKTGHW